MRASLRATYGIDLREARTSMRALDLADLVVWLPAGSPLWMDTGGPASISREVDELHAIDYRLQVLTWLQSEDGRKKRNRPEKPKPIPYRAEADAERARDAEKFAAHAARQAARSAR